MDEMKYNSEKYVFRRKWIRRHDGAPLKEITGPDGVDVTPIRMDTRRHDYDQLACI